MIKNSKLGGGGDDRDFTGPVTDEDNLGKNSENKFRNVP